MIRPDSYHVHTVWCDGNDTPEEMVKAAITMGMGTIGFSAHAAWPFAAEWHLPVKDYPGYIAEIGRLKSAYAPKIRVLCGFEADYIPGITIPDRGYYARFKPDYLIGSVHYVLPEDARSAGNPWAVDAPADEVAHGIENLFAGDGKAAVKAYWQAIRDMVETCDFDIIGHLDVIRKRNGILKFFDESATWYRHELEKTVATIARSGKIVELNTGGIARKAIDSVYPSMELLGLLRRANVPVTLNSDAHSTGDLLCAYDRAVEEARIGGYSRCSYRTAAGWAEAEFPCV